MTKLLYPWDPDDFADGVFPYAILPTSPTAYISGYDALELNPTDEHPEPGAWGCYASWWTLTRPDDDPDNLYIKLWGPDGYWRDAAPITPQLRDARAAFAEMSHPAASHPTIIHAATVQQAIIDLAFVSPGFTRHQLARFCGTDQEDPKLRQLVEQVADALVDDPDRQLAWLAYAQRSMLGSDHTNDWTHTDYSAAKRHIEANPSIHRYNP